MSNRFRFELLSPKNALRASWLARDAGRWRRSG
jgi:hypothetical protein